MSRILVTCAIGALLLAPHSYSQEPPASAAPSQETLNRLLERLQADEARIKELESRLGTQGAQVQSSTQTTVVPPTPVVPAAVIPSAPTSASTVAAVPSPAAPAEESPSLTAEDSDPHAHMMDLPGGGPSLKIRGFFDFDFGLGSDANSLQFPIGNPGIHNTFQAGEFDLFMSSKLSNKLDFTSEVVIGSDSTNFWGLDIERVQLTYTQNKYFAISGGRYHTAIGYYNTAFHHGTWFQTTTGRPFMYFYEDSGGILPVHSVGITTTGLVPGTDSLGLHWVAEVGNGRSSDPRGEPAQDFLSDKNHKDFNVAFYIAPQKIHGLQIGGSYYRDRMIPSGVPHVNQNIESLYAIYVTPTWEFFNEAVALNNRSDGQSHTYHTPLMYTQISRKFGSYRPYFRYQYVNSPSADPINIYTGRYMGPSLGLRMDFTDYAAFKLQYNRLYQRDVQPRNGLDAQVAFTF